MQNQNQNMSDLIESYLKNVLLSNETVEIRRSEIADQFNCVPSQINYVINTRFTIQQGYVVESKRGGGGYIRIMKVNLVDEMDVLNTLGDLIPPQLSVREANHLLQNLYENELISKREAQMMALMMEKDTFPVSVKNGDEIRSNMMKKLIDNLKYR
ncbi:CtsR family transcriptional regulator [Granulicatella adiacens]|jgi:transcriptional regulator ctsR|uniref:CtsR family transcriptional regulator n=1 Tax=Granulicatella TaxID=117563 RepID=UPI00066CC3B1|nr:MULTISPECIES: CtsR family transcriptional regulator [Granulicatella]MDJ8840712.1 CtsR family transcriptional regulator [Salmonella enterica]OFT02013.1 CtsR family transcriptional regulator [Granulicatella sp. HMSC31F03]VTX52968.1 Transcriptional regulator CtsR [Granulicatella adiacens]